MQNTWQQKLDTPAAQATLNKLYLSDAQAQKPRIMALVNEYQARFGQGEPRLFSSPGRTEIGGNHTDHNKGCVLAAAVTLDMLAVAEKSGNHIVTLYSAGYANAFLVDTQNLALVEEEKNTSYALIRGILFKMKEMGFAVGGFNAVMDSRVLSGSGLSSSAAFEVLIATIVGGLYNDGTMDPVVRAKICQWVENEYFGKPSGLMDQCACSVGGLVSIDFGSDDPIIEKTDFDFAQQNMTVVVLATNSSHHDLTGEYAAIPLEMQSVAKALGEPVLSQIDEARFYLELPSLRAQLSDRALLRAMHFFDENRRVKAQVAALKAGDFAAFLRLVIESGNSSWMLLQNLYVGGAVEQSLALSCALSKTQLEGRGAWRVHGGGFAGTTLNFVPNELLGTYIGTMNRVFGENACTALGIRPVGAVEIVL